MLVLLQVFNDGSQCQFRVGVVLTIKIQADGNNTFVLRTNFGGTVSKIRSYYSLNRYKLVVCIIITNYHEVQEKQHETRRKGQRQLHKSVKKTIIVACFCFNSLGKKKP